MARTFFFDTFFWLAFLVDFTVFFFEDATFLRPDFDGFEGFDAFFDFFAFFDGRREADLAGVFFFTTFFLPFLLRLLLFLVAALFAGITGLQDDSNETGDYTDDPRQRK